VQALTQKPEPPLAIPTWRTPIHSQVVNVVVVSAVREHDPAVVVSHVTGRRAHLADRADTPDADEADIGVVGADSVEQDPSSVVGGDVC
jgi:hypothetical protein